MALFFDQSWFDATLAGHGLTRADAARALGLTEAELAELWKDQREVLPRHISTLALLLDQPEDEVRRRAGVQGPPLAEGQAPAPATPPAGGDALAQRLTRIEERLSRLEADFDDLKKK